jgi:hypothetical protein
MEVISSDGNANISRYMGESRCIRKLIYQVMAVKLYAYGEKELYWKEFRFG